MKSFNIVTFSLILFGGFLLTSCNQTNVVDILNSLLKTEKWTFGEKNTYYNYPNLVSSDLLITDSKNGNIVTEDNVKIKLLKASELISYEYAITLHWLIYKLFCLNRYFIQNISTADIETRKQYTETMELSLVKIKQVAKHFLSALQFLDNLEHGVKMLFLKNLIERLLTFNVFKFETDSNKIIYSLYDFEDMLDNFIKLADYYIENYYEVICNIPTFNDDDLDIKYKKQSNENKKSPEELAHLKYHCELILKSVDDFIEKKYTNLGFIYDEYLGESYYNL